MLALQLVELNDCAINLLEAGRTREAAAGFRHLLSLQPSAPAASAAYFNLGIAMKDLSLHRDAATAYLAALDLKPDFPQAHFNLARSFQMLADDPGPAGYLRAPHALRREVLLRAAHRR